MFNQIATEARFTLASSAQLTVDATYLSHLFTRYSPQVGGGGGGGGRRGLGGLGGLKETLAACRLLLMSSSEAGEVMRRASGLAVSMGGNAAGAPAGYKKDEMLSRMGVACLTPQQIMSVIERRVY